MGLKRFSSITRTKPTLWWCGHVDDDDDTADDAAATKLSEPKNPNNLILSLDIESNWILKQKLKHGPARGSIVFAICFMWCGFLRVTLM